MFESGEKVIKIQMNNLWVFLRPHIFLLLNHFFVEGMPKYSEEDLDLPNNFIDDVDNASPIKFNLNLHWLLFCLDDEIDVVGCSSNLVINFEWWNLWEIKKSF